MPAPADRYVVFYDGRCQFCTDGMRTLRQMESSADLTFVDVRNPTALADYPQVDPAAALGQMHVLDPAGRLAGGFDAILALMPALPSIRAFHPLLRGPLMRRLGSKVYRWVARNRYRLAGTTGCAGGACKI